MDSTFRIATPDDIPTLAAMNEQLIRDEGHRSRLSRDELEQRMAGWLADAYHAALFTVDGEDVGYALFKPEPEWVYLRQFFVSSSWRRQGIGRAAMQWLMDDPWKDATRIRLDVLVGNSAGMAFWKSIGFDDYCLTMEFERPAKG